MHVTCVRRSSPTLRFRRREWRTTTEFTTTWLGLQTRDAFSFGGDVIHFHADSSKKSSYVGVSWKTSQLDPPVEDETSIEMDH